MGREPLVGLDHLVSQPEPELHYHVWRMARTGRIYYRTERGWPSREVAEAWQRLRIKASKDPPREFIVLECRGPYCGPKRDKI